VKTALRQISAVRESGVREAAFTMVEIAISLAIIGFALVAIIGVLPIGMNVQRENREETIINQDATYFIDAIRSGARGLDNLTQSVMGITIVSNFNAVSYTNSYRNPANPPSFALPNPSTFTLINGERIIGLLGTPKYDGNGTLFWTNQVVAYVRALSGLAVEKFPQDNADVRQDAFSYRLITENLQLPVPPDYDTNSYSRQLTHNLRELRLSFRWPLLPNGNIGNGRQTFRTTAGGQLLSVNDNGQALYFFQPQTFVKAP
jgi:type II secretory pathway pseudopilin PulG